ncbi:30S ribosomal protein S11-like [Xenia sp. Carnegie-2017]|uniref:30S ribosomal protein S11-like n=1 Tax=Xenia sp. Carnegie-2017 TaxID=2897299 RepID=UPI001F03DFA9|nr:30S ribosomal protein S11-like [Xenia sp. Carnegie-2017]
MFCFIRHKPGVATWQNVCLLARRLFTSVAFEELPIMHVNATYNNTIVTLTDHCGNTLGWKSAGSEGFKNARRGTNFAGQQAAIAAAKRALDLGITQVRVKVKGMGPGRKSSVKGFELGGLSVYSVTDVTPIPHNGCRPRKVRRL